MKQNTFNSNSEDFITNTLIFVFACMLVVFIVGVILYPSMLLNKEVSNLSWDVKSLNAGTKKLFELSKDYSNNNKFRPLVAAGVIGTGTLNLALTDYNLVIPIQLYTNDLIHDESDTFYRPTFIDRIAKDNTAYPAIAKDRGFQIQYVNVPHDLCAPLVNKNWTYFRDVLVNGVSVLNISTHKIDSATVDTACNTRSNIFLSFVSSA